MSLHQHSPCCQRKQILAQTSLLCKRIIYVNKREETLHSITTMKPLLSSNPGKHQSEDMVYTQRDRNDKYPCSHSSKEGERYMATTKITQAHKYCSLITLSINGLTYTNKNTKTISLDKKTASIFLLGPKSSLVLDILAYTCLGSSCLYFFVQVSGTIQCFMIIGGILIQLMLWQSCW